jgi:hypothetical protein
MPLFVTVTPGTTVTSSTTLDASTLNLLGTPSVDVSGTVDGGSITLGSQSVPLPSLYAQNDKTIVGNGLGSMASPVALDASTDFAFTPTTFLIKAAAVTTAKIADSNVTYAKIQNVADARLLGRSQGAAGVVQELTVGANLTLSAGVLNALRPAVAFTNYTNATSYTLPALVSGAPNRAGAVEIAVLTTSITTQTATSKVLVQFNISCEAYYATAFILERVIGAAVQELGIPTSAGSRINGIKVIPFDDNFGSTQSIVSICFVDSPGSATSVSYRIKAYSNNASGDDNLYINRSLTDTDSSQFTRATSQVILQEILP